MTLQRATAGRVFMDTFVSFEVLHEDTQTEAADVLSRTPVVSSHAVTGNGFESDGSPLEKSVGLKPKRKLSFANGPIPSRMLVFDLY